MPDQTPTAPQPSLMSRLLPMQDAGDDKFAQAALERHKREGLVLAVRARWVAGAVLALTLPLMNPWPEVMFYEIMLGLFLLNGWALLKIGTVKRSMGEGMLHLADVLLLIVTVTAPNPFASADWPAAMAFRGQGFNYIFILFALATLSVSPRSVWAGGVAATLFWIIAIGAIALFSAPHPELTEAARAAFGPDMMLAGALDPNEMLWGLRVQEVVVLLIVSVTLAVSSSRFTRLLSQQAGLERERANLARYFSPNVVEELSHNDEPLKQVREQNVAVLFVDIVGFTQFAADRSSEEVIHTLRDFHGRMEREVFGHDGTLDKYLGDGLMATFGTPFAGERDALNALSCARAMARAVHAWNAERSTVDEEPIRVGLGLHYGPAVLGDIGANRLEFAVIGSTVNIASRVESMTRALCVELAATDELLTRARQEAAGPDPALDGLERHDDQVIRGLDRKLTLWTCSAPPIGKSAPAF